MKVTKRLAKPTLLNSPLLILTFFFKYMIHSITEYVTEYYKLLLVVAGLSTVMYYYMHEWILYSAYWISLGIASSIGLGTGLHTFVLFLTPFIIQKAAKSTSMLNAFSMVYYEVFCWGFGTAIGELPPYFVSRAAAQAGINDPDFVSIDFVLKKRPEEQTYFDKIQIAMYHLVSRSGFWGILLCASVPNPLFDLAGIICGRFGVDFATFFSAVAIGKSLIKSNIQAFGVILLFRPETLLLIENYLKGLPYDELLITAIRSVSNKEIIIKEKAGLVSIAWNLFLAGMIIYFVLSTVESLALSHMQATDYLPPISPVSPESSDRLDTLANTQNTEKLVRTSSKSKKSKKSAKK